MSSSSSENEADEKNTAWEEQDDSDRTSIRAELSSLSFEELQKLKQKIGAKVYNEALFGKKDKFVDSKPKVFKRENKNRPREISSKTPVPFLSATPSVKKKELRDPRFDPLCGEFDKKQFSEDYNFLSDLRIKDIKAIRAELKETTDPEREKKLRRLLQRLNDQHKASKSKKVETEKAVKHKEQMKAEFREGIQPHFKNKSTGLYCELWKMKRLLVLIIILLLLGTGPDPTLKMRDHPKAITDPTSSRRAELRVEALVKQYEELKKEGSGRIQRHLKRRQQKVKKRSYKATTGVSK